MKTLLIAIALIFFPVAAIAQTCETYYQYEFTRDLVEQGVADGTILTGWIIETEADLEAFNKEVGGAFELDSSVDTILAIVLGSPQRGYVLYVYGYKDGCQVKNAEFPWVV